MNKIYSIALILFLLPVMVVRGQTSELDERLQKQVDKVFRYPSSKKQLDKLSFYYHEANKRDLSYLYELKESGKPDIWYEVYLIYNRLSKRQEKVGKLPPRSLEGINFVKKDYSNDIETSGKKAAAFFYAHATKLVNTDDKMKAQLAYDELYLVAKMFKEYRDLDQWIRQAILRGANNLSLEVRNKTGKKIDPEIVNRFENAFENVMPAPKDKRAKEYDFTISIILDDISVTEPQFKTERYIEERDVFNENGNVTDTIRCTVTENFQRKASRIKGKVLYVDENKRQVVNSVPVSVESIFLHKYATVTGNIDACGEETRKMLMNKEVEYPGDKGLIMDAVKLFNERVSKIISPSIPQSNNK